MKKEQIKRLLPALFQSAVQEGDPLSAVLEVMEIMHSPSESALDSLEANFNPYLAPDAFVPYLASWVDLELLLDVPRADIPSATPSLSTGLGRLRELTAAAATLSRLRGTCEGLSLFLKTATGAELEIDERVAGADGKIRPFHLQVTIPKELAEHRALIERIVEMEKPAYVTHELVMATQ